MISFGVGARGQPVCRLDTLDSLSAPAERAAGALTLQGEGMCGVCVRDFLVWVHLSRVSRAVVMIRFVGTHLV